MKTLWLSYDIEGENTAYATLFEGGDITQNKKGDIIFKNPKEIKPTIEDMNMLIDIFTNAKKQMESA